MDQVRCTWANKSELEKEYHDNEWGVVTHDDQKLFEMLVLETKQAGLSWSTILAKRESLRQAFDQFNPVLISQYKAEKVEELLQNPGIIRNKLKINATINNAKTFLRVQEKYGSFDQFIWAYVDGQPLVNQPQSMEEVPSTTSLSDRLSKDLKKEGFKFVGSTTVYAFMQSIGMVDDHLEKCFKKRK